MKRSNYIFFLIAFELLTNLTLSSQDLSNLSSQKPFKINGNISTRLQYYNSDKTNPGYVPFMWYLQGNPVVTVYGIVLPFSFRISEQQRDFRQPFNQFGVSPYYKWVKLHLGYNSLNWSNFALAGHSISGAGFELSPGKFHVGFITGRLLKPIKYLDNPGEIKVQTPAYKRIGTAFTLGYGTNNNNINLVILKAKDDSTSISDIPSQYQLTPDENLVVSLLSKQVIAKKILFEFELAQSLYTKDTRTEITDSTNDFMARTFSFLMKNHKSTSSSNAFRTAIGYQSDNFNFMVKYQRIDPGYQSMGAYYFLADLSNITVEPSLKLMKKKLTIGGSFGSQIDNLNKDKNLRTRRTITSARIGFMPVPQYNLNAFYSNYGIAQESGLLAIDTLRKSEIAQATSQFGVTQSANLTGKYFSHNLVININFQKLNDKNDATAQYSEFTTGILSAGYFINYMPWNINGSVSYMYTSFKKDTLQTIVTGPTVGLGKSFLKNKLSAGISWSFMNNKVQDINTNNTSTLSVQLGCTPVKNHRFAVKFYRHINKGQETGNTSYYENKLDFDYTYTF